jgi:hypothetical protein
VYLILFFFWVFFLLFRAPREKMSAEVIEKEERDVEGIKTQKEKYFQGQM